MRRPLIAANWKMNLGRADEALDFVRRIRHDLSELGGVDVIQVDPSRAGLTQAMTIALLIQDSTGDFYSSMFVTSGLFGLIMYVAGIIAIFLYKPLLPVDGERTETVDQDT